MLATVILLGWSHLSVQPGFLVTEICSVAQYTAVEEDF